MFGLFGIDCCTSKFIFDIFQYSLLWIQKIYGPKKIFPKFMLPPVFDYKLEEEINI